jgi:peroxiredoxin
MTRTHLGIGLLALALAACSGGSGGGTATGGDKKPVEGGGDATDFTLGDVDGKQVSLSQYLGKGAIVISFWATWCKPCKAEMPHLQKMYDAKKDKGFVVLAISIDRSDTEAEVAPFIKKEGFTFPVLLDTESRATSLYNPRGAAPYTVVISKSGKIVKQREGFNPGDEKQLEADVEAAMK